jgi:hypothetical protein
MMCINVGVLDTNFLCCVHYVVNLNSVHIVCVGVIAVLCGGI